MIRKNRPNVNSIPSSDGYHATRIVSAGTLASRVLGVVREQVIAYLFGASAVTDAFVAAFRIPNLLRDLFAEGALSAAFVPNFTDQLKNRGPAAALDLYQRMFNWICLIVGGVCVLGVVFTPQITLALAAGYENTPGKLALTMNLARVMFPFLLFVSLAALAMGALNSLGRFGPPAFAPMWFNVGSIVCAVVFSFILSQPVYGLAIGVVVGGVLQWWYQARFLAQEGYHVRRQMGLTPEVRRVFRLLLPAIIGLAAVQVNIFVITRAASGLGDGPVSYLNFAYRLIFLPLGVFAVAAATVGLPRFSQLTAAGDTPGALASWGESLRLVWYLVVPTTVLFIVFGEDICRVLFQHGAFTAEDTKNTASALTFYSFGLPAMATIRVTAPVFYAHQDTRTPVIFSFLAVAVNLALIRALMDSLGFRGLALAIAAASTVQTAGLLAMVRLRYGPYRFTRHLGYLASVTVIAATMALGCRLAARSGSDMLSALAGLGAIVVAAGLYLLITWVLKFRETRFIWGERSRHDTGK